MKEYKNLGASIRQRLLNRAKESSRPFNEILVYYAMERFLYRLSCSSHSDLFILKGGVLFNQWFATQARPTMDIDLLGKTSNDEAHIIGLVQAILGTDVMADGLSFDIESIKTERITQDVDTIGIRVRLTASLDAARVMVQLDIGFDDDVFPQPLIVTLPTLLELPPPMLRGYTMESAIAEKLDAMIRHGALNSRMKDFFDIWMLSRQFAFTGDCLTEAIRRTFKKRSTVPPQQMDSFQQEFIASREVHWRAFSKRMGQASEQGSFQNVVRELECFVTPPLNAIRNGEDLGLNWTPEGKWR
jgi:predicted nucleotidyltransferase component of viral defense system